MLGNYTVASQLVTSQVVLSSIELVKKYDLPLVFLNTISLSMSKLGGGTKII
jgi:hypothetical protein